MITVTRINDREVLVNSDQIETIEEAPDTTITMLSGRKIIVRDDVDEIVEQIVAFKRRVNN